LRVFALDGGNWIQRGDTIPGERTGALLGRVVSISSDGDIVACSTNHNYRDESNSGSVLVFMYNVISDVWTQLGSPINSSRATDSAPTSLGMSSDGHILAIGSKDNDDVENDLGEDDDSGSVRVFVFNNNNWIQRGYVIYGENNEDKSGIAVALSSDGINLAVGAKFNDGVKARTRITMGFMC